MAHCLANLGSMEMLSEGIEDSMEVMREGAETKMEDEDLGLVMKIKTDRVVFLGDLDNSDRVESDLDEFIWDGSIGRSISDQSYQFEGSIGRSVSDQSYQIEGSLGRSVSATSYPFEDANSSASVNTDDTYNKYENIEKVDCEDMMEDREDCEIDWPYSANGEEPKKDSTLISSFRKNLIMKVSKDPFKGTFARRPSYDSRLDYIGQFEEKISSDKMDESSGRVSPFKRQLSFKKSLSKGKFRRNKSYAGDLDRFRDSEEENKTMDQTGPKSGWTSSLKRQFSLRKKSPSPSFGTVDENIEKDDYSPGPDYAAQFKGRRHTLAEIHPKDTKSNTKETLISSKKEKKAAEKVDELESGNWKQSFKQKFNKKASGAVAPFKGRRHSLATAKPELQTICNSSIKSAPMGLIQFSNDMQPAKDIGRKDMAICWLDTNQFKIVPKSMYSLEKDLFSKLMETYAGKVAGRYILTYLTPEDLASMFWVSRGWKSHLLLHLHPDMLSLVMVHQA